MRLTKKVFYDLGIYMIGFGIIVGMIFPVFTRIIGIPSKYVDIMFIVATLFAGIIVGVVNILLAKFVVGRRLKILSARMKYVNKNLENVNDMNAEECLDKCMIPVDSTDEIGESSESFNNLVKAFLSTLNSESSIRNFTEIFTNELDLGKLSEKALTHLIGYTGATAGVVLIDKGGEIEVSYSHLIKDPDKLTTQEIVHKCFTNKKRVYFELTGNVVIEAGLVDFQPNAILLEPIVYKGEVLGAILLASVKHFEEHILNELNVYTHGLSLGMHNAIIHDKLEQLAILDPLTKIYNRRFGMERLKEEYGRCLRTNDPLGVLMLDIDYFKKVNDTYGHIIGDQVLIAIANIIKSNIRKGDILVRYGGEEFLALLPGASRAGLVHLAEKIRRYVEEHSIKHNDQDIKVTISIGGTSFPEYSPEELEGLIQKADESLYVSKDTGRNKSTIV